MRADRRRVDNRLALIDQASFLGLRATGVGTLVQCTWTYERPLDVDGLHRFHYNLGHGLLGRRIARSPLPFGRHSWVSHPQQAPIDFARRARPRADLSEWIEERARLPIDPQWGPGWHIGVLPLENQATAVSLVASHSVVDGLGLCRAVSDAARGRRRHLGYPSATTGKMGRRLLTECRLSLSEAPEVLRGLRAATKLSRRGDLNPRLRRSPPDRADRACFPPIPSVTVYLDAARWDTRAEDLGGTGNSLFGAFAAKLAHRVGRVRDGLATLAIPVSERTECDTRANALTATPLSVAVDPTSVTADLREIRAAIKQGLLRLHDDSTVVTESLALTPLIPKRLARRLADVALGNADLPVGCSNLGELDPAVGCPDGTPADSLVIGLAEQGVTKYDLDRAGGKLFLCSGRLGTRMFINVVAYLPGKSTDSQEMRQLISQTLADFGLADGMPCGPP